jgi:hypothetical protein
MKPALSGMGIDLAKNIFHLVGLDERGTIIVRKRLARGEVLLFMGGPAEGPPARGRGYAMRAASPPAKRSRAPARRPRAGGSGSSTPPARRDAWAARTPGRGRTPGSGGSCALHAAHHAPMACRGGQLP